MKKDLIKPCFHKEICNSKILIKMRNTLILIFITVMNVYATDSYSQKTILTLDMKNVTVKEVLAQIETQSEFYFLYNTKLVDVNRTIDINVKAEKIDNILSKLFQGTTVDYFFYNKQIILSPEELIEDIHTAVQQTLDVRGNVTNEQGTPLVGVNVVVKGTLLGTFTDGNGVYSLSNVPKNGVLVFTFVGMTTNEVSVNNQSKIDVIMIEGVIQLDEIVTIGYGSIEKKKLTSAITNVTTKDFIQGATTDAGMLLGGKVAGLVVIRPGGDPNNETLISLRGVNSLSLGATPLILIDGVEGDLKTVVPEDIQSIDILKDASSAAIYGTRGTNGVILITTRQAVAGKTSIRLDSYISSDHIVRKPEVFDAAGWRKLIDDGKIPATSDYNGNTDWWNEMTRSKLSQLYNLSFSSGTKSTSFIANINYKKTHGVMLGNQNQTLIGRLTVNQSMFNEKLKINLNWNTNFTKYPAYGDGYSYNSYFSRLATIANPTMPVYKQDGSYAQVTDYTGGMMLYQNPVSMINETDGINDSQTNRIYGNINFTPIYGLKFNTLISLERFNESRGYFESFKHPNSVTRDGYGSRGATQWLNRVFEFTAEYKKILSKHDINAVMGYHYDDNVYENFYMQNYNFPTDQFSYNNFGLGSALTNGKATMYSYKSSQNLISFFSRLNYIYDQKYLVTVSLRYEGSSKFIGSNQEWGLFPSLSLGWRISNENFLKNVTWINDLKLRVGYGITGNAPDALYRSLYRLRYGSSSSQFYYKGNWVNVLEAASNRNPEFTWEKKGEINLGLDFSLLRNRVYGNIDFYNRKTIDMLYDYPVPTPPNVFSTTYANVGEMENTGLEANLNVIPLKSRNFEWTTTLLFSTNKNKLISIDNDKYQLERDYFYTGWAGDPPTQYTHIVQVGHPIGEISTWHVVGITDEGKWLIEGADGQAKLQSAAVEADRRVVGNGYPKFFLGFNNLFKYKGFDLNITMRGAFGFKNINISRLNYENTIDNGIRNMLLTAYDKVFNKAILNDQKYYNDYYVEDGDFWKIDNIVLGYTFKIPQTQGIKSARIFISSLNTYTITNYKGIDPEVGIRSGVLSPGIDDKDQYPSVRTLTFGVNLEF
jgi:TonB-dependent starch-binding outer membrane protein SusC